MAAELLRQGEGREGWMLMERAAALGDAASRDVLIMSGLMSDRRHLAMRVIDKMVSAGDDLSGMLILLATGGEMHLAQMHLARWLERRRERLRAGDFDAAWRVHCRLRQPVWGAYIVKSSSWLSGHYLGMVMLWR
jgi:hypothetical protein